jgi:hypothetical protein
MPPARSSVSTTLRERLAAVIDSIARSVRNAFVRSIRSPTAHGGGTPLSDQMQPAREESQEQSHEQSPEQSQEANTEQGMTQPAMQPESSGVVEQVSAETQGASSDTGEISEETQGDTIAEPMDTSPTWETIPPQGSGAESGADALVPGFETQLRRASDVIVAAERAAEAVGLTIATTGGRIECDYDMVADVLVCKSVSFDLEF